MSQCRIDAGFKNGVTSDGHDLIKALQGENNG